MKVELKTLRLLEPFRIAHGVSSTRQVVRVWQDDGVAEAPFVPYYGEDPVASVRWLEGRETEAAWTDDDGPRAARLALDLLRLDMEAKSRNCTLADLKGCHGTRTPLGCKSLGIPTDLNTFSEQIRQTAQRFRVLKLKLGSGNADFDEAIVAKAREAAPDANLLVDVNGGWSVQEAAKLIPRLEVWRLSLVEQPIHHRGGAESWRELRALLPETTIPLFADESAQTASDVAELHGLVEGINVKLLKCASFDGALRMIQAARAHGMSVLVGCMIESSLGVTAAAHLASLADWIDLDGHLYVEDDFVGLTYDAAGRLQMPKSPGIGATSRA